MAKSAREAALTVLERCRRNQAFSDALLGSAMQAAELNERDRALCTRMCYGVLQNMILCDYYIDAFTAKAQKLEPKVRDILRLSVYQMVLMDRIPAHAAVSQGVELCIKCGCERAKGLVNAVLRRVSENLDKLPEIPQNDISAYISIKYSTPKDMVVYLVDEFGPVFTEALLKANNEPAPMTVQTNTQKTTTQELITKLESRGIKPVQNELLPDCLDLIGTGDLAVIQEHAQGFFYVQDAAARLSVMAGAPKPGDRVLDACSAPGGKSLTAALMMQNEGELLACDIHEKKLGHVSDGAARLGIHIIQTAVMDAAKPNVDLVEVFDLVIADVPCSGLGVIRKKPDIRYKPLAEISKLPETQFALLNGIASCVKAGGVLLYSTCTVLKRENDGVIDRFLAQHPEFSPESFELPAPIGHIESGRLRLYSHIHHTDGFFICKLRKSK